MRARLRRWAKQFKIGSKIPARVLWISPAEKRVALSLAPHLCRCADFSPHPMASPGRTLQATAGMQVHRAALVTLKCAEASLTDGSSPAEWGSVTVAGMVPATQLKDLQRGQQHSEALARLKPGESMPVVSTGVRWLDGTVEVSARPTTISLSHLTYDELEAGQVRSAHIVRADLDGARLKLGRNVMGKVKYEHLTDQKLTKPHTKFVKGQVIECVVLEVAPERRKLLLSLKTSLVTSTLPRLTRYEDAKVGVESHGVVEAVRQKSSEAGGDPNRGPKPDSSFSLVLHRRNRHWP